MDRRMFLRGVGGAVLGLPVLESLAPRGAAAQAAPEHAHVVIFRQGCGVQQAEATHFVTNRSEPENWWPRNFGAMTAENVAGRAVSELGPYVPRALAVGGVRHATRGVSCAHTSSCNRILTAADCVLYGGMNETHALGQSVDNFLAERMHTAGRGPLFFQASPNDSWAVAPMSYVGARMRRTPDYSPLTVYRRMMGLPVADNVAAMQLATRRRSVNDLVREQFAALVSRPELGADDRRRLGTHLEHVRDTELMLAQTCGVAAEAEAALATGSAMYTGDRHSALWGSHTLMHALARLQIDTTVLALACGYIKVAIVSVGGYSSNGGTYVLPGLPPTGLHLHQISHRGSDGIPMGAEQLPESWRAHHEVDRIHLRDFKYLLDKLATTSNARGPLLDQGVAVYLNDIATGGHTETNLPFLCVGTARGVLRAGQYVDAREGGQFVTHNRFLNTLITAAGVRNADGSPYDSFGKAGLPRGVIPAMLAR